MHLAPPPYRIVPNPYCPQYEPLTGWRKWARWCGLPVKRTRMAFFDTKVRVIQLHPANAEWMRTCLRDAKVPFETVQPRLTALK